MTKKKKKVIDKKGGANNGMVSTSRPLHDIYS